MENMDKYENPKINYNIVITIGIAAFFAMLIMFAAGVAFAFKAFIFSAAAAIIAFLFLMSIILEIKYYEEKWNMDYKHLVWHYMRDLYDKENR